MSMSYLKIPSLQIIIWGIWKERKPNDENNWNRNEDAWNHSVRSITAEDESHHNAHVPRKMRNHTQSATNTTDNWLGKRLKINLQFQ